MAVSVNSLLIKAYVPSCDLHSGFFVNIIMNVAGHKVVIPLWSGASSKFPWNLLNFTQQHKQINC